jgi:hypothetical protein
LSAACACHAAELDVNGDGFLSAEELSAGLKDCDIFADVESILELMEEEGISDDGSGKGLISAQAFEVRASGTCMHVLLRSIIEQSVAVSMGMHWNPNVNFSLELCCIGARVGLLLAVKEPTGTC